MSIKIGEKMTNFYKGQIVYYRNNEKERVFCVIRKIEENRIWGYWKKSLEYAKQLDDNSPQVPTWVLKEHVFPYNRDVEYVMSALK